MTSDTPRRDQRCIITADTLRAWTGTDAELARRLGVGRQAVYHARRTHGIPAAVNGNYGPRPGLSPAVCTAIVKEVRRRAGRNADDAEKHKHMRAVMEDVNAWASLWLKPAEGPEVDRA